MAPSSVFKAGNVTFPLSLLLSLSHSLLLFFSSFYSHLFFHHRISSDTESPVSLIFLWGHLWMGGLHQWLSGKESTCQVGATGMQVRSLGGEVPLEKGMATHSSILAWRVPWTEEPGRLHIHRVTRSRTRLEQLSTHPCTFMMTLVLW